VLALASLVAPLRVRVRRPPARPGQALHTAFAAAPTLCHGSPGGSPDAWARTTVSRGARSFRRACVSTSTATDRSSEPGSPVNRRHARFEALLPPRVRSPISLTLAGVGVTGSLLSWDSFPSRACSGMAPGTVCRTDTREDGPGPSLMHLWKSSRPPREAGTGPRPWVLESRIRWSLRSIEPRGPPSGSNPARDTFAA